MIVLMTGGTGFIGRQVAQALIEEGHEVRILSRRPRGEKEKLKAQFFVWDGEKQLPPEASLKGVEAVIHLAGESIAEGRWTAERKERLYDSRILTARNLLSGFKKAKLCPKVLLAASAVGYYGTDSTEPKTESSSAGDDFVARLCQDWESSSKEFQNECPELRWVQLRLGVVLGREGGFLRKLVPLFRSRLGAVLGSGQQWISWIQMEDLVSLFLKALSDEHFRGVINATAPEPVTNEHLSQALSKELKVGLLPAVPSFVLRLAYGELAALLLKGPPVTSHKLNELQFEFRWPQFEPALKRSLTAE